MFKTPFNAQEKLVSQMNYAFFRGAAKLGWRMALLAFVYVGTSTSLTVIRDQVTSSINRITD